MDSSDFLKARESQLPTFEPIETLDHLFSQQSDIPVVSFAAEQAANGKRDTTRYHTSYNSPINDNTCERVNPLLKTAANNKSRKKLRLGIPSLPKFIRRRLSSTFQRSKKTATKDEPHSNSDIDKVSDDY